VLYLKRPRGKIYRSDALCMGASDTATWRKPPWRTMGVCMEMSRLWSPSWHVC